MSDDYISEDAADADDGDGDGVVTTSKQSVSVPVAHTSLVDAQR